MLPFNITKAAFLQDTLVRLLGVRQGWGQEPVRAEGTWDRQRQP